MSVWVGNTCLPGFQIKSQQTAGASQGRFRLRRAGGEADEVRRSRGRGVWVES